MAASAPRGIAVTGALAAAVLGLWAVAGTPGCGDRLPDAVDAPRIPPVALMHAPFAELSVPAEARGGEAIPTALALDPGAWASVGTTGKDGTIWRMPAPFRPRGLFFFRAQEGMALTRSDGSAVPFRAGARGEGPSWSHDRDWLTLVLPPGESPPPLNFAYPKATERERALNRDAAIAEGLASDAADFVRGAEVLEGWTSREGLLLPAPARVSWDVLVPEAAILSFTPGLVRPELGDAARSDGARLTVTVDDGSGPTPVHAQDLVHDGFALARLDLSRWSGKTVRLAMETAPGPTSTFDYAFVGEPVLHARARDPRRVILVFVDTLRPDHLGTYGYERPTSPTIDAFAAEGVVFEQARSVAPWTLPSARTVVTGRQPELYDVTPTIQAVLGERGWATAMFAGNVYLSANFGMSRDWDTHDVGDFDGEGWTSPPADAVTDRALAWLAAHEGQDALVMVHYMNVHLPYQEPVAERFTWASATPPDGFPMAFSLTDVRKRGGRADVRQYVVDRYDQTIHWVDGELARLFAAADDDDVVVLFSDHGEEFWEHGGFEHGHTLYDELLRVPLVVRAPGVPAGRVSAPVSLLDVAPTVYDALGIDPPGPMDGSSLLPVARGDASAAEALTARPQAFGRPLYGARERWGVLDRELKWTTDAGSESLHDLAADPGEHKDLAGVRTAELPRFRETLGAALGRPSGLGFRVRPSRDGLGGRVTLHVPGGVGHVWAGEDPLGKGDVTIRSVDAETVELAWRGGPREVFVLPTLPAPDVLHRLCLTVQSRGGRVSHAVPPAVPSLPDLRRDPLLEAPSGGGVVQLTWAMGPAATADHQALVATDDEMTEALEAIGYTDEERGPVPEAGAGASGSPCDPR